MNWSAVVFCIVIVINSVFTGYRVAIYNMQKKAIEINCAHYDPKTSEFVWGTHE